MMMASRPAIPVIQGSVGRAARRRCLPCASVAAFAATALLCFPDRLLSVGLSFALNSCRFPLVSSPRTAAVTRHVGFGDPAPATKRQASDDKVVLTKEDLQSMHGDKWELVDAIFKGKKAESPEAIMRARFTALKYKDPGFLAATEQSDSKLSTMKKRKEQWSITLGLKEKDFFSSIITFGDSISNLKEADSFEVVDSSDTEVEFKIRCKNGKVLHERSSFNQDKKYGYVYSGDSAFGEWTG